MTNEAIRAVILAAGRGSRMKGLTDSRPKCLTELAGRPLLDWQVRSLRQAGVEQLAVVRGYQGDLLARPELDSFENPRWAETNMVMSLAAADPWLSSGTCLVCYGDIVYSPETVRALMQAEGDLLISYDQNWLSLWQARFEDPLSDAESFELDARGRLIEIGQRVTSLDAIQGQYMGLLRFTPAGWSRITALLDALEPAVRDKLDMTSLLRRLLQSGVEIGTVPAVGGWLEVDSAADLAAAEQLIQTPAFGWMNES